ncbi:hypothetical protein [Flavitalea sp.]|nr:hypothetical protein [Flavitalea sp.]
MKKSPLYSWTGLTGIALYLLVLLEIPLYFVYTPTASGTPPVNIILARIIIDLFICLGLIGFFSGFKTIISNHYPSLEWAATFIFALGLAFAIVAFIADSIQAGSVWIAKSNPVDPTWVGYGGEGALLIYGPINRLLTATILIASGAVILKSRMIPVWTGWLAFVISLYNLAFIPTIFFMTTPLDFYSVNGWNIPIAAGLFFMWVFIISILFLRKKIS